MYVHVCKSSASGFLTVQLDVVTLTPVAPKRRSVQGGAANLDAVVQFRLQVQNQPRLCECRRHLETSERESVHSHVHWGAQQSRSSKNFLLAFWDFPSAWTVLGVCVGSIVALQCVWVLGQSITCLWTLRALWRILSLYEAFQSPNVCILTE